MMLRLLIAALVILFPHLSSSLNTDGLSLLALKAAVDDPTGALRSWSDSDPDPCGWPGIGCTGGRVTSLELPSKGLTGYIPSELGLLDSLQLLSLAHNNFSKLVPARLFNATGIRSLDLSHNSLSGPIPDQIAALTSLTHLDLSSNLLNGSLPDSLSELSSLAGTLNLSDNLFSGEVPESYGNLPVSLNLDFRYNNLTGKIPQVGSLLNQGPTAFFGNPGLCGFPLESLCPEAQNPGSNSIASSSSEEPQNPRDPNPSLPIVAETKKDQSSSMAVPVISGVSVVVGVVSLSAWVLRRKWRPSEGETEKQITETVDAVTEDIEGQKGKFVVMDEGFNLELEDLLRASAYVVGKGRSGIVYKVVAGRRSGVPAAVVAVRRLSEGNTTWRLKEFESEVEGIGRVHHPNILRLRAYYFANDEKLLVSDFIGNGSLYTALHGGLPDSSFSPLSWSVRLKIAQGMARGLMYIHECSPRKYVHGNIKSTKILLNDDLQPYISGFGLSRLVSATSQFTTSASRNKSFVTSATGLGILSPSAYYVAPEARVAGSKATQKCDVYSFGIVLMEILTGRQPDGGADDDGKELEGLVRKVFREERPLSEIIDPALVHEVHAKKQVIAAFHIALNCAEVDPELRPRMRTVSESLDRIKSR